MKGGWTRLRFPRTPEPCGAAFQPRGAALQPLRPSNNIPAPAMDPVYLTEEHRMLRDTARRYIDEEVEPHGDAWEAAEEIPRGRVRPDGRARLLRRPGAGGLWRHGHGAGRHGRPVGGARQIQLWRILRQYLGPRRDGGPASDQRRHRGTEGAPAARPDRRAHGQQHRGHGAGRRLRRRRPQDEGRAQGQRPLGA